MNEKSKNECWADWRDEAVKANAALAAVLKDRDSLTAERDKYHRQAQDLEHDIARSRSDTCTLRGALSSLMAALDDVPVALGVHVHAALDDAAEALAATGPSALPGLGELPPRQERDLRVQEAREGARRHRGRVAAGGAFGMGAVSGSTGSSSREIGPDAATTRVRLSVREAA